MKFLFHPQRQSLAQRERMPERGKSGPQLAAKLEKVGPPILPPGAEQQLIYRRLE